MVGGKHSANGLDDSVRALLGRVDLHSDLGDLSVVDHELLKDQHTGSSSGSSAGGVVDDESLNTVHHLNLLADEVVDVLDVLLSDSVVTTGEVITSVHRGGHEVLLSEEIS